MKAKPEEARKRTKRLFILWIVSYCVYYAAAAVSAWFIYSSDKRDSTPVIILFFAVFFCVLLFYFFPLIKHVMREAARIKMKGILIPARIIYTILLAMMIVLVFLAIALVLGPIPN